MRGHRWGLAELGQSPTRGPGVDLWCRISGQETDSLRWGNVAEQETNMIVFPSLKAWNTGQEVKFGSARECDSREPIFKKWVSRGLNVRSAVSHRRLIKFWS